MIRRHRCGSLPFWDVCTAQAPDAWYTKNRDAQKKLSSDKVRGVSPEAGRESMVGKICERNRF